jgi:hypothetical protein
MVARSSSSSDRGAPLRPNAVRAHQALTGLWLLGAVVAFFLAGYGVFSATKGNTGEYHMSGSDQFGAHAITGSALTLVALLVLIAAVVARIGGRHLWLSVGLFVLMIVQNILPHIGLAGIAALHPVNGLLMLGLAGHLLLVDRRALAGEHPTVPAAAAV